MHTYTAENTVVLAKRLNNAKRTYLLVNLLQAKHLPVSPKEALEMMGCLGQQIAARYPAARLVIGFAETATAIGTAVADCLGPDCIYLHTTREPCPGTDGWVSFQEEHSHAVEQRLYGGQLAQWVERSPQIIFVDDELSTGKTLINIVSQLRTQFPALHGKEIVAASIVSRLSKAHEKRLKEAGIPSEYLVRLPHEDLSAQVAPYEITAAELPDTPAGTVPPETLYPEESFQNPRFGVQIGAYISHCRHQAEALAERLPFVSGSSILVLGTEECMYPALVLGQVLEARGFAIRCHATTRSPIGICREDGYPIRSGYRLHSFYDAERTTFLYNLDCYDGAVILTDTIVDDSRAVSDLRYALELHGCRKIVFIEGGKHVQHL